MFNKKNYFKEELLEKDNKDIIPKEKNDKPKQDKKEFDNLKNEVESPENKVIFDTRISHYFGQLSRSFNY